MSHTKLGCSGKFEPQNYGNTACVTLTAQHQNIHNEHHRVSRGNGNPTVDGRNLAQGAVNPSEGSTDDRVSGATRVPSVTPKFNVEMLSSADFHLCKILARPRGVCLVFGGLPPVQDFGASEGGASGLVRSCSILNLEWVSGEVVSSSHFESRSNLCKILSINCVKWNVYWVFHSTCTNSPRGCTALLDS